MSESPEVNPKNNVPSQEAAFDHVQSAEDSNLPVVSENHLPIHSGAENEKNQTRRPLPVLQRLKLGRLAMTSGAIEVASGIAALADKDGGWLAMGIAATVAITGGSTYVAHEHHVNGYPNKLSLFVKDRTHPTIHG